MIFLEHKEKCEAKSGKAYDLSCAQVPVLPAHQSVIADNTDKHSAFGRLSRIKAVKEWAWGAVGYYQPKTKQVNSFFLTNL